MTAVLQKKSLKNGISLVELAITIVIVGVLVSASALVIREHIKKAIVSEAIVAINSLETELKRYCETAGEGVVYGWLQDLPEGAIPGLNPSNYNGTYFSKECYFIETTIYRHGSRPAMRRDYSYSILFYPDPTQSDSSPNVAPRNQEGKSIRDPWPAGWPTPPESEMPAGWIEVRYSSVNNRREVCQFWLRCSGYPTLTENVEPG